MHGDGQIGLRPGERRVWISVSVCASNLTCGRSWSSSFNQGSSMIADIRGNCVRRNVPTLRSVESADDVSPQYQREYATMTLSRTQACW
jgi:hypothetical protein